MIKQNKQLSIFLYTGYTPRATALMNRVEKACGEKVEISLIDSEKSFLDTHIDDVDSILILDLPNIKQSAVKTIQSVKKSISKSKILGIHIYTSKLLIDPLLKAGIDGYLTYEPDAAQLRSAIETVLDGDQYFPPDIYS